MLEIEDTETETGEAGRNPDSRGKNFFHPFLSLFLIFL
jgi:hypothetical protein